MGVVVSDSSSGASASPSQHQHRSTDGTEDSDTAARNSQQDADLLSAVLSAAEREAQPWVARLRDWGQAHKEPLIRVCAPLWLCALLALVQRPSLWLLLLFTAFSVSFGSLFEPFEKSLQGGD